MKFKSYRYSMLQTYQKCRRAFKYSYIDKLVSRREPRQLTLGTMVHRALEQYARGASAPEVEALLMAVAAEEDAQGMYFIGDDEIQAKVSLVPTAFGIATRAWEWFEQGYEVVKDDDGEPMVERKLYAKIPGVSGVFHGTLDLVARQRFTNYVFVWDWKIRKDIGDEDDEQWNGQMPTYEWLLKLNYPKLNVLGTVIGGVRAFVPAVPAVTKDGKGLSRANILTDWPTYHAEIIKHGFDPDDYADMEAKLNARDWQRAHRILRPWREVEATVKSSIVDVIGQIQRDRGKVFPTNLTRMCSGCSFKEICLEELKGSDPKDVIAYSFERKEDA